MKNETTNKKHQLPTSCISNGEGCSVIGRSASHFLLWQYHNELLDSYKSLESEKESIVSESKSDINDILENLIGIAIQTKMKSKAI